VSDLLLKIGGLEYSGWESIRVNRSLETVAGSFELTVSNRTRARMLTLPAPGDACRVVINSLPVITGYVDALTQSGDAESHTITVVGRDLTADLVDCSILKAKQWQGVELNKVLRELLQPFGIELSSGAAWRCERWSVHPGEGVFDAIERLLQLSGYLSHTDGAGRLVVGRPGQLKAEMDLEVGVNVVSYEESLDHTGRFSELKVLGQHESDASPTLSASELDARVRRYRPLVVMSDGAASRSGVRRRAKWEQATRKGKSRQVNVTVAGWFDSSSSLWELNRLVRYSNLMTGADEELLISAVDLSLNEQGTTTTLHLVGKDAFDVEAA
jgi:prophage tail gpP-like protein